MHMADALLSPAVGVTMWTVAGAALAYSCRKARQELDDRAVPLMGVLGAFVFAAQLINFTIPGTGSSGHLSGGLLLAVLLGSHGGFLAMASVLFIQALFFADGGLLALGANIFNLGFFPCFIVYPWLYRRIAAPATAPGRGRLTAGTIVAAVAALQLGSLAVVLETVFSGRAALSFTSFALLMQPIHLAIGLVEGAVTAMVIALVRDARPGVVQRQEQSEREKKIPVMAGRTLVALGVATLLLATVLVRFASSLPDGLEWSLARLGGTERIEAAAISADGLHLSLAAVQDKVTVFPDYRLATTPDTAGRPAAGTAGEGPAVAAGTSLAGLTGGILTLGVILLIGLGLRRKQGPEREV